MARMIENNFSEKYPFDVLKEKNMKQGYLDFPVFKTGAYLLWFFQESNLRIFLGRPRTPLS